MGRVNNVVDWETANKIRSLEQKRILFSMNTIKICILSKFRTNLESNIFNPLMPRLEQKVQIHQGRYNLQESFPQYQLKVLSRTDNSISILMH